MNGYLQLMDGRTVPVKDGLLIGRVAGCDIVVDDGKASRRHARIVVEGSVVEIEDLNSSNGTLLNGKPVTRRVLRAGDTVQIGQSAIVYREGAVPGGAAPAPAPTFADDDDLFAATATNTAAPPPPVAPPPARSAAPPPPRPSTQPPPAPNPPSPPPPPAPPRGVVEFEDEIVEVRRAPEPAPRTAASTAPSHGEPVVTTQSRILQYQKTTGSGGLLGDDLAQLSGGTRWVLYAFVLLLGAGIVYGVIHLVR